MADLVNFSKRVMEQLARVFRELPLLLEQSGGKPSAEQILTLLP